MRRFTPCLQIENNFSAARSIFTPGCWNTGYRKPDTGKGRGGRDLLWFFSRNRRGFRPDKTRACPCQRSAVGLSGIRFPKSGIF
jgi:hypothetical protein